MPISIPHSHPSPPFCFHLEESPINWLTDIDLDDFCDQYYSDRAKAAAGSDESMKTYLVAHEPPLVEMGPQEGTCCSCGSDVRRSC